MRHKTEEVDCRYRGILGWLGANSIHYIGRLVRAAFLIHQPLLGSGQRTRLRRWITLRTGACPEDV